MPKAELREDETHELKERWTDEALKDLAAFANHRGGTLLIGVRDDGTVVGAPAGDADIQRIANIITSQLGVTPSIRVVERQGHSVIEVDVEPVRGLVPYRGRYLRRVGSTNRDFTQEELARHILERSGHSWDALPSPWGIEQCDTDAFERFAVLARPRLPHVEPTQPKRILQNLGLLKEDRLTNGGVLLFARTPQQLFPLARLRIGVFRSPIEIVDSHEFEGTLFEQLDGTMERFRRLLQVRFEVKVTEPTLKGLQRKDVWEYPLEALRETVINALIHRDYTMTTDIQIRLYDDRLEAWNPGELPQPLTPESLRVPHGSYPRNPLLARAFYFAGLIEQWGTGTTKIIALCQAHNLPEPEFENWQGGVRLTFAKDAYTPERLRAMGLSERQMQAVLYVKEHGRITNRDYRKLTGVSDEGARLDLKGLLEKGLLKVRGQGRGTHYVLGQSGD